MCIFTAVEKKAQLDCLMADIKKHSSRVSDQLKGVCGYVI